MSPGRTTVAVVTAVCFLYTGPGDAREVVSPVCSVCVCKCVFLFANSHRSYYGTRYNSDLFVTGATFFVFVCFFFLLFPWFFFVLFCLVDLLLYFFVTAAAVASGQSVGR